jgi:DNA primase
MAYFRTCRIELSEFFWSITRGRRDLSKKSALVERELNIEKEGYKHGLQKILLGMLVHYPEFLDAKGERVSKLQLSEELEEFSKGLYDLLYAHGEVDVELIYSQLGYQYPRYYKVLQDIHGDRTENLQRGHSLFARFPKLAYDPPPQFVEDCIDHFIHDLEIEQMLLDLSRLKSQVIADADFETISNRIGDLVREIHRNIGNYNETGSRLAEDASQIKVAGRVAETPLPHRQLAPISA